MKKEKNMIIAFVLNLLFCIFELAGGIFTGSAAILSDSVHDLGDAMSIGLSCFLEIFSKKAPDDRYTYGYGRYSLLGGLITTFILIIGSVAVLLSLSGRLAEPEELNYNGMLFFSVVGVAVNSVAAFFTRDKSSANQRAVNLHMLEDVLGWLCVLVGSVIMKLTGFSFIDAVLSAVIAVFILVSALKNLKNTVDVFLEKAPVGVNISELKNELCEIEGVEAVHHFHIRNNDTVNAFAELHVVSSSDNITDIKKQVREVLREHGVIHATVETEKTGEFCDFIKCSPNSMCEHSHHHHHHHH